MSFDPIILNSLLVSLAFIFVDTLFGVILSIKNKDFLIKELPRFVSTAVFPYIGGLIILAIFANYIDDFMPIFILIVGLVSAKFGIETLKEKIFKLFE